MKELQRKQMIKRLAYSWPSLILVALIGFFLAKGALGMVSKERESARRVGELEDKATALALREESLAEGIRRLGTPEGIMDEIKEKFSVTREGEYVAIIIDSKNKATSTESMLNSWYKKLRAAIIGE